MLKAVQDADTATVATIAVGDPTIFHREFLSIEEATTNFPEELRQEAKQMLGDSFVNMNALHFSLVLMYLDEDKKRILIFKQLLELYSNEQLSMDRWGCGNTALHLASFLGLLEPISLLLGKKCSYSNTNELGLAPIDVAPDDESRNLFRAFTLSPRKVINVDLKFIDQVLETKVQQAKICEKNDSGLELVQLELLECDLNISLEDVTMAMEDKFKELHTFEKPVFDSSLKFYGMPIPGRRHQITEPKVVKSGRFLLRFDSISNLDYIFEKKSMCRVHLNLYCEKDLIFATKQYVVMGNGIKLMEEVSLNLNENPDQLTFELNIQIETKEEKKQKLFSRKPNFQIKVLEDKLGSLNLTINDEFLIKGKIHQSQHLIGNVNLNLSTLFLPGFGPIMELGLMDDVADYVNDLKLKKQATSYSGTLSLLCNITKVWKKRFFNLCGWQLKPFSEGTPSHERLGKLIDLTQCMRVETDVLDACCFVLHFSDRESIVFGCCSPQEMQGWFRAISDRITEYPGQEWFQMLELLDL